MTRRPSWREVQLGQEELARLQAETQARIKQLTPERTGTWWRLTFKRGDERDVEADTEGEALLQAMREGDDWPSVIVRLK